MAAPQSRPEETDAGHVPITEEFDSPKHTLPDAGPMIIALVLVAIAVGAIAYFFRSQPVASGTIDEAFAVAVPNQNTVLATVQLSVNNTSKKPIIIRNINITVRTEKGEFSDDSANVVDMPRYFAGFPDLKAHSIEGLPRDLNIPPGTQINGSVIVSFPITKEDFDGRRALIAQVAFFDHNAIEVKR